MGECVCSIILCTADREDDLRPTLAAVRRAVGESRHTAEVIVVDNGHSGEMVAVVVAEHQGVRYVREPRRGQCFARNTGGVVARGQVLLFTDDDVRPPSMWVDNMCEPILRGEADAVAGGLAIAPHLMRPWMTGAHRMSLFHTAEMPPPPDGPDMIGANMAISRHVFDQIAGFDPELGPGAAGFKDETLVCWQMRSVGLRVVGRPDVVVEHHFDPERLGRAAFLRRSAAHGRSDAYVRYHYFHDRIEVPAVRAAIGSARLWAWRLMHPKVIRATDRFDPREGMLVYRASVAAGMAVEQRRPCNYARLGLRKVAGVPIGRP